MVRDPVQKRLLEIISSKKKGGKRPIKAKPTATEEQPSNVISIMDALRKSISSEKRSTKR
jgi:DNA end-binding protein Ku